MLKGDAMRANLTPLLTAVVAAVLIAGCSTTPDDASQSGGAPVIDPVTGKPAPKGKPGAQAQKIPGVDLTAKPGPGEADPRLKSGVLARRSIYYDYDQFDIKDEYRGLVEAHAKYLRENPAARVLVQGNTDERGSREYNIALGQRRADAVKKMMMLLGATEAQIETVSFGKEKPRNPGHDEGAWTENRRDDFVYRGE
jgi:peptidoglycan-associated lipoprotein